MKTRVISSLVGIAILAFVLFFYETWFYVFMISVISTIAVHEFLHSTKFVTNLFVMVSSLLFSFCLPFFYTIRSKEVGLPLCFVYIAALCLALLKYHDTLSIQSLTCAFSFSILVPSVFSVLILLREEYPQMGLFYLFLTLLGAWGSDTGAYFAGRAFGKHKLCPNISPNKTVEGFIGGILSAVACYMILALIFVQITPMMYPEAILQVDYLRLLIIAPICSVSGVLGDLFASVIKRQTGIKDYGTIMPGHGGVMDRFDSVLFVSPTLMLLISFFPPAFIR